MRKLAKYGAIALVIFLIVSRPDDAATIGEGALAKLGDVADSLVNVTVRLLT